VADVVLVILLVALLGVMVYGVVSGRWTGTWAGSGRKPEGRRFPGGPLHPPHHSARRTFRGDPR